MSYKVRIEKRASKALEKLEIGIQRRVVEVIRGLADNPRPHGSS